MSRETFLKWLPFVLFYILIFRDPYSAIIPVREPALTYSPETTWLLDGTTNETDFAAAYNRRFKDLLQDERNAFPFFLKAVQDTGYTPSGRAILGSFTPRGDNEKAIPMPGPDSALQKMPATPAGARKNMAAMMKEAELDEVVQIMDRINLPPGIDRYEEPFLSDPEDQKRCSLLLGRYIIHLPRYGQEASRTGKALAHLRLMANTSDAGRLMLAVAAYRDLVNHGPLSQDEIKKLEKDLPPWPNTRSLVIRLQRGRVTQYMTSDNPRMREIMGVARQKDRDFFLDRNELLRTVNRYMAAMGRVLPDRPLDEACESRIDIEAVAASVGEGRDSRPLAERLLFSGSVREKHRRSAQRVGGMICALQAKALFAAMDNLAKVYEPIPKDTPHE